MSLADVTSQILGMSTPYVSEPIGRGFGSSQMKAKEDRRKRAEQIMELIASGVRTTEDLAAKTGMTKNVVAKYVRIDLEGRVNATKVRKGKVNVWMYSARKPWHQRTRSGRIWPSVSSGMARMPSKSSGYCRMRNQWGITCASEALTGCAISTPASGWSRGRTGW